MSSPSSNNTRSNRSSSSSPVSFRWILAAIPFLLLVGLSCGADVDVNVDPASPPDATAESKSSSSSSSSTTIPGLDFGTGSMFDQIATRYDTINRVLALRMDIGWRRQMTTRIRELLSADKATADAEAGDANTNANTNTNNLWRILDVATGTADVALQLVDDLSSGGSGSASSSSSTTFVLGLDPSSNMLAVGRTKIHDRGLDDQIVLEQADARDLSHYYKTNNNDDQPRVEPFDAATMAFGIRNVVPNREKALCEIHKLLKPNGVLAILEFSQPSYETHGVLGAAAGAFIEYVVPVVGGWLSGGARQEYKHLQNSIRGFPAPDEFSKQLGDLECPLKEDDDDYYFYVGHYAMEPVRDMNFGSVQLYVGRAVVKPKASLAVGTPPPAPANTETTGGSGSGSSDDTKLPPIGGATTGGEL